MVSLLRYDGTNMTEKELEKQGFEQASPEELEAYIAKKSFMDEKELEKQGFEQASPKELKAYIAKKSFIDEKELEAYIAKKSFMNEKKNKNITEDNLVE